MNARVDHSRAGRLPGAAGTIIRVIASDPRSAMSPHPANEPRRLRLLVVDDDPDARLLLAAMIEAYFGADVVLVASVDEAVASVSRALPDLVLSDGVMPGGGALELLQRLRGIPRAGAIPVVVVTASIDAAHGDRLVAAGARAVLAKPPDPAVLERAIVEALAASSG